MSGKIEISRERRTIEFAIERFEICQDQAFQSCECEECQQCGKMPDECTGTDCAQTCQCSTCEHCMNELAMKELRAILAAPAVERQDEQQMACMPVERCYDVRAKMIIAFNESRKAGGDLDDGLDAAYKSALRYSPNPLLASPPAPVAVVLPERITGDHCGDLGCAVCEMAKAWNACLDKVKEMNR